MAEDIVYEGKSLEDLERDILCAICQEHYTEPKVLPCLHYYCKQCILKLALRRGTNQSFPCPECRKETTLPEGGVDELKTAFFVHRMEAMYSTVERIHGKVEVKCEGCTSGSNAISFCRQCTAFICKACVEPHQRMKMFEGHDVVSMQDLKVGKAKAAINIAETAAPVKCKIYKKSLKLHCFDCDHVICRDCTVKDHRDHNFEFCAVAAPETKEELTKMLECLRELSENMSLAMEVVKTTKQEVETQGSSVERTIQTSFEEIFEMMKKHKQEMLEGARKLIQEKMNKLSVQEKNLSLASSKVISVVDYAERFVSHSSDNEVMSMHIDIKRQINEIEEHGKADGIMEPVEEADMVVEVRCAEALQQLFQTQAKITQLVLDPAQCTVRGEGVKTAEVHQTAKVTITTILSNNKISRRRAKVLGQLKSLYDGSVIKCNVNQSSYGEYRIQYTPTVRGRHELTVLVDGQQVAGSPFPVFVSIPPTQLGKPVKVLDNLSQISAVALNSIGRVTILDDVHYFLVFYDGHKIFKSLNGDHLLSGSAPAGLATDDEDNVYCTTNDESNILKFNKDGCIVEKVQADTSSVYMGMAVVGDEVMVCDACTGGTIIVYDRELNYLRRITVENAGVFRDISADSHGNIFITDRDNQCIRAFSQHGDLLQSFNFDRNGINVLTRPLGICVSGQFIYVCNNGWDNDSYNVSVFTTEGEYVTTFGHKGNGEGEFNEPIGVCVDTHGFIYVCDNCNNRIQVF